MEFWRFRPVTDQANLLHGHHSVPLMLLSIGIAVLSALVALAVVDRITASRRPPARTAWLVVGAVTMGGGVWAMHFLGMLAFSLPLPVGYSLPVTLASMLPAIFGCGVALRVMSSPRPGAGRLVLGGLLMALGIGTMHYAGMEAIRANLRLSYDLPLFLLSVGVAHVLATVALLVRFATRRAGNRTLRHAAAAVTLGLAVAGMHYTAMAAARFERLPGAPAAGSAFPAHHLGAIIAAFVCFLLAVTIIGTMVDQRLATTTESLLESGIRHTAVL